MPDRTYLDWPFFEPTHKKLALDLDAWASGSGFQALIEEEHHAGKDVDAVSRKMVRALGEAGWLRNCVPAAHGGKAETLDVRSLALSRDTLGRHSGLADFAFAMQGLGSASISLFGSEALKQRYLPGVAKGERIAAFAISEKEAGSDPGAMTMAARREGDHYILDGEKTWISNGGIADQYVLFARTGEAPGAKGLSAFVVDADAKGLSVPERIDVIAPHPLGTLRFENCRVPAANLLGQPGEGFKIAMATLDIFRSTVGAAALGFARRALDEAVARVRERQIGGRPLADYQMTQEKLGRMAVAVDASALLVYRAAWTKDFYKGRVTREASMAKYFATEEAQSVIDMAVQLHGGTGVVSGNVVERLYREIRALRIYEGTSEIQKLIIAGQLMQSN